MNNKIAFCLLLCITSIYSQQRNDRSKACLNSFFDFYFLTDVSSRVKTTDLNFVKDFMKTIAGGLNLGRRKARVSITSFGTTVTNLGTLNELISIREIENAIDSLETESGSASIRPIAAINYTIDNLFTEEHGYRSRNDTVCVLILGSRFVGNSTAAGLRLSQYCRIIAVGINFAAYRRNYLSRITAASGQTISSRRYQDLSNRVTSTQRIMCQITLSAPRTQLVRTTRSSATVRWEKLDFAVRYSASIREPGRSTLQSFRNIKPSQRQVTFTRLRGATSYTVSVSAFNDEGRESPKASIIVTTGLPIPEPRLAENSVTTTSALITWRPISGSNVAGYFIKVRGSSSKGNDTRNTPIESPRINLRRLLPGTLYKVTVATISGPVIGDESTPVQFHTISSPPKLKVVRVRHIAIYLEWEAESGAKSYDVFMKDLETNRERKFMGLTTRTLTVENLTPSRTYEFKATTKGFGDIVSGVSVPLRVVTAPSNPDDVNTTEVTAHIISFTWSPQPAALAYKVFVTTKDDSRYNIQTTTRQTIFRATRMRPGFIYRILVLSVGRNDVTDANVIFPLMAQTIPLPPAQIDTGRVTDSSVEVTWGRTINAGQYEIFTKMDGEDQEVISTADGSRTSAIVENLEPGKQYEFRVRAIGSVGAAPPRSGFSEKVRDSTYAAVTTEPVLTQVNSTIMSVNIEPAEGAESYIVFIDLQQRSRSRFSRSTRRELDIRDISSPITITRLIPGKWYNISVASVNKFDKENPIKSKPLHEQTVPNSPKSGVTFPTVTTSSIAIEWPKMEGAYSYVLYATSEDFDDQFTEEYNREFVTSNSTYLVDGLKPGTVYQFNVQSVGFRERKSAIGVSSFTQTIPAPPQNPRQVRVTKSTIRLEWDTAKGASGYRVRAISNTTDQTKEISYIRVPPALFRDLIPGIWYGISVYSRSGLRRENPIGSDAIFVQTVPSPPDNVKVSQPQVNSLMVSWDESVGAFGYIVRAFSPDNNIETKQTTVRINEATQVTVTGLDAGTRYRFFVRAVGFQQQQSEEGDDASEVTLPATPDQLLVDRVSSNAISISWDRVKGAIRYAVHVVQELDGKFSSWEVLASSSNIRLSDLAAGAWYNLSVSSVGIRNRRNTEKSQPLRVQTVPLAPNTLGFDQFTTSSIRLQWNRVIGAGGYYVTAREVNGDVIRSETETEETNVVLAGLEPGTAYTFEVATIGEGNVRSKATLSDKEETNPATPNTPTVLEVSDEHIRIEWNKVKGARRYIVQVSSPVLDEVESFEVSETSTIIHSLESGTSYSFSVFSVGARNRLNPDASETITAYTAPSSPTGVKTRNVSTNSLILMWNAVQGALSYSVTVKIQGNLEGSASEQVLNSITETELQVDNLEPGTEYQLNVQAIGNEERISVPHPEFTEATLPEVPQTPSVNQVSTTTIRFSWPQTPGAHRYNVFVTKEGEEEEEFSSADPNYFLTDLESGIRYTFSIESVGALDRLSARRTESVTQQTITEPAQRFRVTSTKADLISLEWDPVVGAASYQLIVKSSGSGDGTRNIVETSIELTQLSSGTEYEFILHSVGDNETLSSDAAELDETTLPVQPTSVTADNVTSSHIELRWSNVVGALMYEIRIINDTILTSHFPHINLQRLEPGLFYQVQVFSIGVENRYSEEGSEVINIQTNPLSPTLVIDSVSTSSFVLSWDAVEGASSYAFEVHDLTSDISEEIIEETTEGTQITLSGLEPGVEYSIAARTISIQRGRNSKQYTIDDFTLPSRPDDLKIEEVTSSTIEVSWEPQRGATSYVIEFDGSEDFTSSSEPVYHRSNLFPGTFYNVVVYSVGESGRRNPEGSDALRVQTASAAATNFVVTDENVHSISLSWDDVPGRSEFEIVVRPSNPLLLPLSIRDRFPESHRTDATSITLSQLPSSVEFEFSLKAFGQQGQGSNEETTVHGITLPLTPKSFEEVEATTTSIEFIWNAVTRVESYEIQVASEELEDELIFASQDAQYTIGDLIPGGLYTFTVFSIGPKNQRNEQGTNPVTLQTVPLPPGDLRISGTTTDEISLAWEEVLGQSYFNIVVTALDKLDRKPKQLTTKDTFITVSELLPGVEYRFSIQTIGLQNDKISQSVSIDKSTVPAPPHQPSFVDVTTETVTLEWDPVEGAISYMVEVHRVDSDNTIARDDAEVRITVSSPHVVVDNLLPGASYSFVIFSVGAENIVNEIGSPVVRKQTGESMKNLQVLVLADGEIRLNDGGVTLPPTGTRAEDIGVTSFTLKWNEVFGATSYNVYVYESGAKLVKTLTTTGTSTEVTSLNSGVEYEIRIYSVGDGDVQSTESTNFNAATLPATPNQPSVVAVTTTTISLEWNSVIGAVRYFVGVSGNGHEWRKTVISSQALIEDLRPGATYDFVIFSFGVNEGFNAVGSPTVSQQTVTLPPASANHDKVMVESFFVRWEAAFGALSYNVYVNEANSEELLDLITTNKTSTAVRSLKSGTEYEIRIFSVGAGNVESTDSTGFKVATLPDTLELPTVRDVTTTSITIEWNAVVGAVHYVIQTTRTDVDASETNDDDVMREITTNLFYEADDLTPGGRYSIVVFSVGVGNSINDDGSPPVRQQTVTLPPAHVAVHNTTVDSFSLEWGDAYGASFYSIYIYKVSDDNELQLSSVESSALTSYVVTSLQPGTEYRIHVKSVGDDEVESGQSMTVATATEPKPATMISTYNVQSDSIDVEWSGAEGVQRYLLIVVDLEDGTETTLESEAETLTVLGLMPGTFYQFSVVSIGALGVTNINRSVLATTQTVPLRPKGLQVGNVTLTSLRVSWKPAHGAASYIVFVTSTLDQTSREIAVEETSTDVLGLSPGTQYFISVLSVGMEEQFSEITDPEEETTRPEATPQVDFIDVSTTNATLLWQAVRGAVMYEVSYRRSGSNSEPNVIQVANAEAMIEGLSPGIWYEFSVFSIGTKQRKNEQGSSLLHLQTEPLPPQSVMVGNIRTTSVVVTWDEAIGAASYRLYYKRSGGEDDDVVIETASSRQEVGGLTAGTGYSFAVNSIGEEGQISSMSRRTSVNTLPTSPTDVEVIRITTTLAEIKWTEQRGALSYRVSARNLLTNTTRISSTISPPYVIPNLQPGAWYELIVYSVGSNDMINNDGSEVVRKQTVPRAPQRIQVTGAETNSLSVTWRASIGAASYHVVVTSPDVDAFVPSSVVTLHTSITFDSLSSGTAYSFSVTAIGEENQRSEPGQAVSETVLPGKPAEVRTQVVTTSSISLTWREVKGAIRYRIVATNQENNEEQEIESEETSGEINTLLPGNRYKIVVFSISADGKVNPEGSDALIRQTLTNQPIGVRASNFSTTSILISWQRTFGAKEYIVRVVTNDFEAEVPAAITTSETSATIDSLTSGETYTFTITAVNLDDQSSSPSAAVVENTLPAKPQLVEVVNVQTTSMVLSWLPVKGALRFRVQIKNSETNEVQNQFVNREEIVIEDLEEGTLYEVEIFSVGQRRTNEDGSQVVNVQTVPLPPINVKAAVNEESQTTVELSWQRSKGASSYIVTVTSDDNTGVFLPAPISTTELFTAISKLSHGTRYSFSVRAVGVQKQESSRTPSIVRVIAPATVGSLSVTDAREREIHLDWDSVKGAIAYVIRVRNTETGLEREVRSDVSQVEITFLEPGTFYDLSVQSVGEEQTNLVASEKITPQTRPEAPTDVAIQERTTTTSISLQWKPAKGAVSYEVVYSSLGIERSVEVSVSNAEITGLQPGTAHRFQVIAVGDRTQKSKRSAEVEAATKPEAISSLSIPMVSTTGVTVQWSQAPGSKQYRIIVENLDDNVTVLRTTRELSATVPNLPAGTRFGINVVSIGDLGQENINNTIAITTQTVPNPPRTFEATEVATDTISLIWSPVRGASSYIIDLSWNVSGQVFQRNLTAPTTIATVTDLIAGTSYKLTARSQTGGGLISARSKPIVEITRPDVTTRIQVVDITPTTVNLRWGSVKGARRYEVNYKLRHSDENLAIAESQDTEITINSLRPGMWYEFVVYSIGFKGRRNEEGSPELHLQTVPLPPSSISLDDVTTTSLLFSWNNVTGADSYSVRVVEKDNLEEDTETLLSVEEPKILVQNLASGTSYDIYVRTIGEENQQSDESDVISTTTLPDTPSELQILRKTTTTLELKWRPVKGAVRFEVSIEIETENSQNQLHQTERNGIIIEDLTPGARYSLSVKSVGAENRVNPTPSEKLSVQTVTLPPDNIQATNVLVDQIDLQWNSVLGAQSYVVRVVDFDVSGDVTITTTSSNTQVKDLASGTRYQFYVITVGDEDERSSESAAFVETTIPSMPQNVQLASRGVRRANISWDFVKGAILFTMNVQSNNTDQELTLQSPTNHFVIDNLLPGGWYDVAVTSFGVNNRRNPTPSKTLSFQTVPLPPRNIIISQVLTNQIELRWDRTLGARSYLIRYTSLHGLRQVRSSSGSIILRNLTPGTQYDVTITTIAQEEGLESESSDVITEVTTIDAPEIVEFQNETATSVTLLWEPVQGATSYTISGSSTEGRETYNSDDNRVTITSLAPGVTYSFTAATIDRKGRQSVTRSQPVEVVTITFPPDNLQTQDLSSRSFSITWEAPRGARSYEIVLLHNNVALTIQTVQATRFTFSSLNPGTLYDVRVTALNANDKKSSSVSHQQRTVPLPPASLRVQVVRPTHINIAWTEATGGSFYVVFVTNSENRDDSQMLRFEGSSGQVENLLPGTLYEIAIATTSEENIRSARNTTITQQTMSSPPDNLSGVPVNESAISLDWNDVKGASFYNVYLSEFEDFKKMTELDPTVERITESQLVIAGLQPQVNYTFAVTAINEEGLESDPSSKITLETYALSPELPESDEPLITITNVTQTSFIATWDPIPNAVGYQIIVRSAIRVDENPVRGRGTSSIVLNGQIADTDYNVTLRAVGLIGELTDESFPPAQVRTMPFAPLRPFGVRVTKVRATFFELAWEDMPRAMSYDVLIYDEALKSTRTISGIRGTSANITGLIVLDYYNVTVISVGKYEKSEPSSPVRVQTRYPIPVIPRNSEDRMIHVSNITFSSFTISVEPVDYAVNYIIIVRRNRRTKERIDDAQPLSPELVNDLEQNTLYDISYIAVGRGGERSEESDARTIRTRRLVPEQPGDFQVISLTSGEATVQWSPARFAIAYRVSAQDVNTGLTRFFNNVSSPFVIRNLAFRETYNLSVMAIGQFFDSQFVTPIKIEIPYPGAGIVNGIRPTQVSTTSFNLRWSPTPFAISYTVVVTNLKTKKITEIRFIRRSEYRVRNLEPVTSYNVTVNAVSHNSATVQSGNYITVRTARGIFSTVVTTTPREEDVLAKVVQAIVSQLVDVPNSIVENGLGANEIESPEEIAFRSSLELSVLQLTTEVSKILSEEARLFVIRSQAQQPRLSDMGSRLAVDNLLSISRELKLLVMSNSTMTEAAADSIAERLTQALIVLVTSSPTFGRPATRDEIRNILFPVVHHEVNDIFLTRQIEVIEAGPKPDGNERLTIFIKKESISSSGFSVAWGRYRNIHRYKVKVEYGRSGSKRQVFEGVTSRQSITLTRLNASTTYDVTIFPITSANEIIEGVIGEATATTLEKGSSNFTVTSTVSYNDVILSWNKFPPGIKNLRFRIVLADRLSPDPHQEFTVNGGHSSVRFTSLLPGTNYVITATANRQTFYSSRITTMKGRSTSRPEITTPASKTLVPPTGLHLERASRGSFSIAWDLARIVGVPPVAIRYNVRVYSPDSNVVRRLLRFQRGSLATFSRRILPRHRYDITVSSYNILEREESAESPRLRIDLGNRR